MGKERTAVTIEALHRGIADSFGVKKWKGKGRGSGSEGDTRRRGRRGVRSAGRARGRWLARRGSARGEGTGEGRTWAAAAMGLAQKNSNLFDLFKEILKISDLIRLKMDFPNSNFFK
jgi:hypothetical protein